MTKQLAWNCNLAIVDNKLSRFKKTKLNDGYQVFWLTCEAAVNNCAIDDPTDFDVAPSSRPHDSAYKMGKDQWQTIIFVLVIHYKLQ